MKKRTLTIAVALLTSAAFAQDLTSKKGEPYLPESGDWALSIDAVPFLNYAGNFFGKTNPDTAPTFNFLNSSTNTIVGKMFIDEKTAYRAILRIGFNNYKQVALINDASVVPPVYPAITATKEDVMKISSNFIGIGAGYEMRRGKTRLQGFYGADAMIWLSGTKAKYEYGNALVPTGANLVFVNAATTTEFNGTNGTNRVNQTDTYGNAARVLENKAGSTFGIGVRGFIGVEYFIFPKIALGGQFSWGIGFQRTGQGTTTKESIGGTGPTVGTQETKTGKSSRFVIDTDNSNSPAGAFVGGQGALMLTFHF